MTATIDAPAPAEPVVITEPGVYDIPDDVYHADPVEGGSLSSTGARRLLPPSCPALFRYAADNPPAPKATFDLGHAAHKLVLGSGPELVEIQYDDLRTKAAKEAVADVRAAGAVPLKSAEYQQVHDMADAIRVHPIASMLFRAGMGRPEQTLVWRDKRTGAMLRARLDWLRTTIAGRRLIVPDYKTTTDAHPDAVAKTIGTYGYHIQGAWYVDGVLELGLAPAGAAFVLVMQEKTPPYLVTVVEPAPSAMDWGTQLSSHAIDVYRECTATGLWPGYSDTVEMRELPRYVEQQYEIARDRGDYDHPRETL